MTATYSVAPGVRVRCVLRPDDWHSPNIAFVGDSLDLIPYALVPQPD